MLTKDNKMVLPEVGKEYAIYDDGKVRFTRLNFAKVIEIIPYEDAPASLKDEIIRHSESSPHLFNYSTPYFIKCHIPHYDCDTQEEYMETRYMGWTKRKFWFDIYNGFMNDGQLDVTGELSKWLVSEIPNMIDSVPIEYSDDIKKLKEVYNF